jgi:hypothetical protein
MSDYNKDCVFGTTKELDKSINEIKKLRKGCGMWFICFEKGRVGLNTQCGYQYRKNTLRHLCDECKKKLQFKSQINPEEKTA